MKKREAYVPMSGGAFTGPTTGAASRSLSILLLTMILLGCTGGNVSTSQSAESIVNFNHLDHLLEWVEKDEGEYAIVHIYSEAPDYGWVDDDDEGAAAVDDAARAAVLYLRHFELTGKPESRRKAEGLLRFIRYMQTDAGLFYNFVWDSDLNVNEVHPNSVADEFTWWAARSVWALGRCVEVFQHVDDGPAAECLESARRTYPHLQVLLSRYGETVARSGRSYPAWLVNESGADATSELLLGLLAINRADPDPAVEEMIRRFGDGLRMMQYGKADEFPYAAHASWIELWHAWGNAQTQALSQSPDLTSARLEAENFYPRLLIDGWIHSMDLSEPDATRRFEQIAYGVRCVAIGLLELFDATGDPRYAKMAGLAASWFTGNNVVATPMYDPSTGRGFDGIQDPQTVNFNSGAESTIEALYTILEIEEQPLAATWLYAEGGPTLEIERGGKHYIYRIFSTSDRGAPHPPIEHSGRRRLGLVLNLTDGDLALLEGEALDTFLQ